MTLPQRLDDDALRSRGRRLVAWVIACMVLMSVFIIVTFNLVQGHGRLPQQLVRFVLTLALCRQLYRGAPWARWVTGVLLTWAGPEALANGLYSDSELRFVSLALGVVYSGCALLLLFEPSVQEHFRRQPVRPKADIPIETSRP